MHKNKIVKMNTLQCEMCVQILSPDRVGETAASLVKANEAAEMLNPVYVYCDDCKYHLCKRCDYHAHISTSNTDSSDSEADRLLQQIQKKQQQSPFDNQSNQEELNTTKDMDMQNALNNSQNKTDSPQKNINKVQPNSADKLAASVSNSMIKQKQSHKGCASSSTQEVQSNNKPMQQQQIPRATTDSAQDHQRIQVCEECLEKHSHAFCPKCEQALCQDCWEKIHNKGARARHRQKSLLRPKFYPPHTWRKGSTTNQQSAGSSSQQDSLSQFKQEHVLDEVIVFEEKDRIDRQTMLGSLQVQLVDRSQAQFTNSAHEHEMPQNRHNAPGQFQMQGMGRQSQIEMPPHGQQHLVYGQSPSFLPPVGYQQQNQSQQQYQQAGQFPLDAAPFHPQMHAPSQPQMQPMPGNYGQVGYHQHQHHPMTGQSQFYMYQQQQQQPAATAGPSSSSQSENPQTAAAAHKQQFAASYPSPQQYGDQHQSNVPPISQMQQQQQQFMVRQDQQTLYSDVSSRMHHPMPNQQTTFMANDQNFQTRNVGQSQHQQQQQSEDEGALDVGIHDEARHQVPTAFIQLDSGGALHHHHNQAYHRHGNQNSESQLVEKHHHGSKNLQHQQQSQSQSQQLHHNQKQTAGAAAGFQDNLNSTQSQKFDAYGGSTMQKRGNDSNSMSGGYEQLPSGNKAFTPLRKGIQSTSECIPSPLLSTPNEQLRVGGFMNSKQLTPPLPIGGSQRQTDLKLKSGGTSHQMSKANKPLKVPKDRAYMNAQASMQGYGGYMGKPPTGTEKKGPHIHYQQKTGKPNSLSSHEMNSDNEGEAGLYYSSKHDQKLFDAYQLGHHQQSSSAKGNPRSHHNMPHSSGNFLPRKNTSFQNGHEYSPRSHQSHNSHNSHNSSGGNMPPRHADQDHHTKTRGSKQYQNNHQSSRHSNYQYGDCANSSSSYNDRPYKGRNDSRGSGRNTQNSYIWPGNNKPNSLLNHKSGSGGNPGSSNSTYNGNGGKGTSSSNQNQRSTPSRMNQQAYSTPQSVPIFQPFIKVIDNSQTSKNQKRSGATRRGTQVVEETKSSTSYHSHHSSQQEENEIMTKMQRILFQNAALGDLLILKRKFIEQMQEKLHLSKTDAMSAIDRAVSYSMMHQTDRNFANSQKIEFISLKIQVLSHQCLQWVITSLRRDEMTPTDSAIKNRTKEAFDFKLQNDQWEAIMKSIQSKGRQTRKNDVSLPAGALNDQYQLSHNMQQYSKKKSITPPDKGSSAQTQQNTTTGGGGQRNSQNINSSFITQSSAGSSQHQHPQATTTTTTTVSAQGITKIIKYSVMTEADTGSGSTVRNRPQENASSGGEATGSSDPVLDSNPSSLLQQHGEASSSAFSGGVDLNVAPRFKVVLLHGGEDHQQAEQLSDNFNAATSGSVFAIFMEDEQVWTGVDIEDDTTVDRRLYQIMKEFLRQYFCKAEDEQSVEDYNGNLMMASSNVDDYTMQGSENLRMIPGGRYGCTQFLKICGPEEIRKCSVGKTTQMVQLAIKEDVLRHLKTQIVWSTQVDKHKSEQDTSEDQQILVQRKAKLEKVKEAIIEILAESKTGPKTGMSLAQLPQYLKKKLPFNLDWNELGFPKLKDLLQSMTDQIIVELRDVNHPFAYLVHHKQRPANQSGHQNKICIDKLMFREKDAQSEQNLDRSTRQMVYDSEKLAQIVQAVFTLLQMHPQGILEMNLKEHIQNQINFEFSFSQLGCGSEYEFVQKYIMPKDDSIEFITMQGNNGQKTFNIRSKKIFRKFFVNQMVQERECLDIEHRVVAEKDNQFKPKKDAMSLYPSSMSHKNFNRGPKAKENSNTSVPSQFSNDQQNQQIHQQRIQTQPNDNRMPPFALQQAYFQTCESIYGSDSQSYDSSLHHQVKAISDLSKSIHLDIQESASTPPFTQQAQTMQQQMKAQHHNPWQQVSAQQQAFNSGGGIFDDLKVPSNIHGTIAQTPFFNHQLMQGNLCIPIDQDDHHQAKASQVQPKDTLQPIFQQNNYDENDSPRVHEIIQQNLFGESPTGHHDEFYPQQQRDQNALNAGATDSVSQNNFSMSDGGCFMNQSIFSADFNRMPRGKNFKMEQQDGHHSVDLNVNLDKRAAQEQSSSQEEYFPLFIPNNQSDDQVTSKTWQPMSNLSQKLDMRAVSKPNPVKIPSSIYHLQHQASFHEESKQRITEETSGSHHSSTPKTPETGEQFQKEAVVTAEANALTAKSDETGDLVQRTQNQ